MASRKLDFAEEVMDYCTKIAQNSDFGSNARDVFNDRGYDPGGADPILDDDVAGLEVTAADVTAAMVFFENLGYMLNDQSITEADYDVTLNRMRNDL